MSSSERPIPFRFDLPSRRQAARWLLPAFLILLVLTALLWLPWQAQRMESNDRQEQLIADTLWVEQAIRFQLSSDEESLGLIGSEVASGYLSGTRLRERLQTLMRNNREINCIDYVDASGNVQTSTDDACAHLAQSNASANAAEHARQMHTPQYSQPAPIAGNNGPMQMDFHLPLFNGERYLGSLIANYRMDNILDQMVPWWFAQDNEISLTDGDDNVIARRAAGGLGHGVYTHAHAMELTGATITLHTNSTKSAPKLLPNLLVGSVVFLSLGLLWSLWALWRDINRRLRAEGALRQQVAFRTAMENSLVTGLRARDLDGRITYVNPAFCQMVGATPEQLIGKLPPMPYWAPEAIDEYRERFAKVLAGHVTPQFETIFLRANGERFPVLVFESPLVDDSGKQTGWMGSILDISDRKRAEELSRQQQEKLQSSARLASMGEIASTLAHELNQPLAAISSYTSGALNILNGDGTLDPKVLRPALEKANAQAQRAGQIIRSVHAFVKQREPNRETVQIQSLIDNVMPLIELQAHQLLVSIHASIAPALPPVNADRMLLEQVLFNLMRNALEAMQDTLPERRMLRVQAALDTSTGSERIQVSVIDQGHGIADVVAERLFSPFFSTKAEGMGMGLNICRTTIEFHGGTLTHAANPNGGTIFTFTLPVATGNMELEHVAHRR